MSRSKRLGGVANAAPQFEPSCGGCSSPKVERFQSLVFFRLLSDVLANHGLFAADRGHPKSSRPKVLNHEIPLPLSVHPRQMNCTLFLAIPYPLRCREIPWNRDHHMHMIRPQMPLFNLALLLLGQPTEYLPPIPPQFFVQRPIREQLSKIVSPIRARI